jgi:hypothetical protein
VRAASVLVALLVLPAAAGCFGGGGSADEFRTAAEQVCTEYDEKIDAVVNPTDIADLERSSTEIADLLEEQQAELQELSPPGNLSRQFADWLELNEDGIANAREISSAAADDDQARIRELAGLAQQNARQADRLANDMGIRRCMIEERELTNR